MIGWLRDRWVIVVLVAVLLLTAGCRGATTVRSSGPHGATTTTSTTAQIAGAPPTPAPPGPASSAPPLPANTKPAVVPAPSASPPPPPTAPAPGSRTVTVTEADHDKSYVLHRNDRLVVQLAASPIYTWTGPASSNDAALHRTAVSSGAAASAVFLAAANGQSTVAATHNPDCYAAGCRAPSRLFQVTVTVTW